MKFKDLQTGNILETDNEFVIKEMENKPEKYEPVKDVKSKK